MVVEICANSYQSASNALKAGADRIELCSELAVGGVTPSHGLISKVIEEIEIDVNVLVRPRSGDFNFSDEEFDIMKRDVVFCKNSGCTGIVSGILTKNNEVDLLRTKELIDLAAPLSFTFHRAFDWVENPMKAIEDLIDLGVDRILTSGQASKASEGLLLLRNLKEVAADQLILMPGGGINEKNILEFKKEGFKEIHFSATIEHKTIEIPKVTMNSDRLFDETILTISDLKKIERLIAIVK